MHIPTSIIKSAISTTAPTLLGRHGRQTLLLIRWEPLVRQMDLPVALFQIAFRYMERPMADSVWDTSSMVKDM